MKLSLICTVATALLLSSVPATAPLHATTAIQRCVSADGNVGYTDKACSTLGAANVVIPGALLTRIAHEEARYASDSDVSDGVAIPTATSPVGRRAVASGCARTPTQLAMDLRGSLTLGDVNRVAESYDWRGMSGAQANRTMDRLQHLIGKPVLDSHYFDAQIGMAGDADAGTLLASNAGIGGEAGVLQLILGADATRSAIDFDVHRAMGCYFVSF
jgi:hypothetical protein